MFTWLMDTVFPTIADFFGIFGSIATIKLSTIMNWIDANRFGGSPVSLFIGSFNVFTGQVSGLAPYNLIEIKGNFLASGVGVVFGSIFNALMTLIDACFILPFSILELPLFISLPLLFSLIGVFVGLVKFVKGVVLP